MMLRSILTSAVLISGAYAAELTEKFVKRLESADANYQTAVQKADNVRFYAVQKANQERLRLLKSALADATKAGDFDAATEIKRRLAAAELAGPKTRPKNVVKFGGHEYALIEEKATWHVAKRLCEEMGGHLATFESSAERATIANLCRQSQATAWVGASDEDVEGQWKWITGKALDFEFRHDNANEQEHCMIFWAPSGDWDDNSSSSRSVFVCEWDN